MKRKLIWISVFAVLFIMLTVLTIQLLFTHYWFIAGEYLGLRCDKEELSAIEVTDLVPYSLSELMESGSVVFNQSLILINGENLLANDFQPDIVEYKDTGVMMNRCVPDAYQAVSAAVAEMYDEKLYISSDYRTEEEQEELHKEDKLTAAQPGSSEHEAGLALDVYVPYYAGFGFIKSKAGRYVNEACWKYGFIIRYPSFGESETGIPFEPWHLRYVGEPHAKIIYNNHLTLEEYIQSLHMGVWYETDGYILSRQQVNADGNLLLPNDFGKATISPDNTGCYVITIPTVDKK